MSNMDMCLKYPKTNYFTVDAIIKLEETLVWSQV